MSIQDTLSARYGKIDRGVDFIADGPCSPDRNLIFHVFGSPRYQPGTFQTDKSFLDELKERGYDIKTIKFSIKKVGISNPQRADSAAGDAGNVQLKGAGNE